jgi:hypothetical protein
MDLINEGSLGDSSKISITYLFTLRPLRIVFAALRET